MTRSGAIWLRNHEEPLPEEPPRERLFAPMEDVRKAIANKSHVFACGGELPISDRSTESEDLEGQEPVTIRWDSRPTADGVTTGRKAIFPMQHGDEINENILDCLVQDGYEIAMTEGKVLQIAPNRFCTTFDVHKSGLLGILDRFMRPICTESGDVGAAAGTHHVAKAELLRLLIFSGPIESDITWPGPRRGAGHFASLFVCLPVPQGTFRMGIRYKEEEKWFNWEHGPTETGNAKIRWAAIQDDCDFEVPSLSTGRHLILLYRLVASAGNLTANLRGLEPADIPLMQLIKTKLEGDPFAGKGGTLGFWCGHSYCLQNYSYRGIEYEMLRGIDAVIVACATELRLNFRLAPVMRLHERDLAIVQSIWMHKAKKMAVDNPRQPIELREPTPDIVGRTHRLYSHFQFDVETQEDFNAMLLEWGEYEDIRWLTMPAYSMPQVLFSAKVSGGEILSRGRPVENLFPTDYDREARVIRGRNAILVTIPPCAS